MCDFISWMRNGLELYYLTEKELNSPKGDLLLSRKDNDPLGHGAIRKYFGLEGITTQLQKNLKIEIFGMEISLSLLKMLGIKEIWIIC